MNFLAFLLGIALVGTFFYLAASLAKVREKDRIIRELSRKVFEVQKSSRSSPLAAVNPVSGEGRGTRNVDVQKERDELESRVEEITEELENSRELIERFEKGLWPVQFRESSESEALRKRLQKALLQEKPQRGVSELLCRIHEICSDEDKDINRDTAVKSGTAIYNWLNPLKIRKAEKEKLLLSYRDWLNKQIEPLGIYSAIVHDGEVFTENLHDANGYGSHVRKVHSLAFYHKDGGVYKKARVTI